MDALPRFPKLAALVWGVAEASLFFVVPDVLIGYLAMKYGLKAGAWAALFAGLGAMVGGAVLFLWSQADPPAARAAVGAVPAVSDAMIVNAAADMDRSGWFLASMKGPLTSTPFKVYAMLAPTHGAKLSAFAPAALPIRLPRFLIVAGLFALIGRLLRPRLSPRNLLRVFTLGWVLFYGWFWMVHPG